MALDARVVGDLVVGEEGRVDDGPAGDHVADDGGDLQVALDDRRPRAHQRVHARARDPRLHVVADLPRLRAALADVRRRRRARSGARDRVGAREVGGVVAPDRPRPRTSTVLIVSIECGASPERMFARLAPSSCSRPRPSEWRRSSSCGVARVVGDDRARRDPSPTSGRRACRRCCRAAAPPGRRRSARTSRSPSARAGGCPRAASAPATGALPSRSARRRTSWARPSISRKTTPGTSSAAIAPRAARLAAHDVALPGLVVVDREQRRRAAS